MTEASRISEGNRAQVTNGLLAITLFLLTVVVYWPAVNNGFVMFDDDINIYQNPHIGWLSWKRIAWGFTNVSYVRRYMPVGWLTYSGVAHLHGLSPAGYHFLAVIFNGLNCVLLFRLLLSFRDRIIADHPGQTSTAICASAALFWALSPMRVETVAWSSGLHYGVSTAFFLAALLAYARAADASSVENHRSWAVLSGLVLLLSLLVYPVMVGAAGCVLAFEIYRLRPVPGLSSGTIKTDWKAARTRLLIWGLVCAIILVINARASLFANAAWKLDMPPEGQEKWAGIPYYLAYFLGKPWWPANLGPVYDDLVEADYHSTNFIIAYVAVAAVLVCGGWLWVRRRRRGLICFLLAFCALLLPTSGILEPLRFTADRYSVGSSLMIAVAVVAACTRLSPAMRGWCALVLGLWCLLWVPVARAQIGVWKDTDTLLSSALDNLPKSSYIRAAVVARWATYRSLYRGDTEGALNLLAPELSKGYSPGNLQALRSIRSSCIAGRKSAEEFVPYPALTLMRFAVEVDLPANDARSAELRLQEALRWAPNLWQARLQLAAMLLSRGEREKSLEAFNAAVATPGAQIRDEDRRYYLDRVKESAQIDRHP